MHGVTVMSEGESLAFVLLGEKSDRMSGGRSDGDRTRETLASTTQPWCFSTPRLCPHPPLATVPDLAPPPPVLTLAGLAGLAVGHVVEDILHGAAVWQGAGPHLPIGLLSPLALVGVEQEHQLLLDQFALLRVGRGARDGYTAGHRDHAHRGHLLPGLLLELEERGGGYVKEPHPQNNCT
jgi:hypothetical protein